MRRLPRYDELRSKLGETPRMKAVGGLEKGAHWHQQVFRLPVALQPGWLEQPWVRRWPGPLTASLPLQCGTVDQGLYVNLTERNLQDAQKFILMHEVVQPVSPVPAFMEDSSRFSHVAVDVVQARDALVHIIYLATGGSPPSYGECSTGFGFPVRPRCPALGLPSFLQASNPGVLSYLHHPEVI